ncbi:hypothetical protein EOA32_00965 [Mesorhizobium sp. M1A.F.Ca.ET.072.01.1.1]|uniref:DUF6950 family protein n=1 Tax=Mesorhizobium sp. M1A.F.Ca.ET.072.01.1.1 TaxID=2496753 RepID=UPI000FD2150C|nr:hypothetical protein [Mesorhizobium sp. M1A.F.Ca.ET.072.01.1.1]RUW55620.1 hypothetical protein EOA32_00965 [Mesorhizobium sp. M1A.F.Ca.ET.072.01.1.1]
MRKGNWRSALFSYFNEVRRVQFDNDKNNCAHFIANGWLCVRDDDPFKPYRKLKTLAAIVRAVRKDGFEDHLAFFRTFMREHDHTSQARVGDIAVFTIDDEIGTASGWVIGERVLVLRPEGIASLPLSEATKAFEV